MIQQLQVTGIEGNSVQLSAEPVRSFMGQKERSFRVQNTGTLQLKQGNWVEVTYPSGRGLLDVFLLLMLPIILIVMIAYSLPSTMPQAQQVLLSLLGLPVGISIFAISQKYLPKMQPEISRILSNDEYTGRSSGCGSGCVCKSVSVAAEQKPGL
ncbi:SoxR reducing system RseC family protein [Candidatus Haliotispira prima]|uniref:SoxR reducing system RseC family protein n=1 Tax=Candidatus Haliotispira prima TaxID=3034016 RepID=A0ABY8MJJ3_9SPIO|nr:SoxR reducing system RseC family protein [Candidatus Haliotispira prima]